MTGEDKETSRRKFLMAGGGAAGALALASAAGAQEDDTPKLRSELLCVVEAELEPAQTIGPTPHGNRQIVYAKGGVVKGSKINGRVLPGGGDWLLIKPDGIGEINVRATMQTDDGALIYTHYTGVLNFETGYFRTTPRFETSSGDYAWLNNIVAVGVGQSTDTGVRYHIYQIL